MNDARDKLFSGARLALKKKNGELGDGCVHGTPAQFAMTSQIRDQLFAVAGQHTILIFAQRHIYSTAPFSARAWRAALRHDPLSPCYDAACDFSARRSISVRATISVAL